MLLSLVLGFLAGRKTYTVETEYIREAPISGIASDIALIKEERPVEPELPIRIDTIYVDNIMYMYKTVDTAAIIADYELRRQYLVPLFDNQYGKLEISLNTQYNKLDDISYTFVPIREIQRIKVKQVWQPFVSASYSTIGLCGIGGGIFYDNIGIEYQWQYPLLNNIPKSHLIGFKWKF